MAALAEHLPHADRIRQQLGHTSRSLPAILGTAKA